MRHRQNIDDPFKELILKEYEYWTLFLNPDQRYLGRAYLWLMREGGMQRLSQLEEAEFLELRTILPEYERAVDELWQNDFINYAWLANHFHTHGGHGHMHLMPRYKEPRTFAETVFVDGRWGKNYAPSEEFKPTEVVLTHVRDALRSKLFYNVQ